MRLKLAPKPPVQAVPVPQSQNRPSQTDMKPSLSKSVTPRSSRRLWGWSIFGVGAASLVTGSIYLAAAHSAFDDANDARQLNEAQVMTPGITQPGRAINARRNNDELEQTYNSRKADSERYEVAAIITGSLGVVGIGVGLWLALT